MPQPPPGRVEIRKLPTGVPGLDVVLGGGIPEYSFNLIAGAPGTGKTTLAEQIMFANATRERPAIHFTVLGEPALKMLRYQQQFDFFDMARVGRDVQFLNLSDEVLRRDFDAVLDRIAREMERVNPGLVIVDSFRTVMHPDRGHGMGDLAEQSLLQRLAVRLTSWEATTFLLGEYGEDELHSPVFTVADGICWLFNEVERNTTVRKLRVTKLRGQVARPGLHTFRITGAGVEIFPRVPVPDLQGGRATWPRRLSTGIPELDTLMGGGIPEGDSVLVAGPTGSGKSILAMQFVTAGVARGERGVIAVFEENPESYIARAKHLGFDLERMIEQGQLDILYVRPLDLSVDETLHSIRERVRHLGATRVVIDSLSGLEVALAPGFRLDFRESFYRLIQALTVCGVTVLSLVEVNESTSYLRFSQYNVSFFTDDILITRYVELAGRLQIVLGVIKMRASAHSRDLRAIEITSRGLEIREPLHEYRGIITGTPERRE